MKMKTTTLNSPKKTLKSKKLLLIGKKNGKNNKINKKRKIKEKKPKETKKEPTSNINLPEKKTLKKILNKINNNNKNKVLLMVPKPDFSEFLSKISLPLSNSF